MVVEPFAFIDAVAPCAGSIGELQFFTGRDLFHHEGLMTGAVAPGLIQPLLLGGQRGVINEVSKRRHAGARILEQHRLEEHGADILLIVMHDLVRKQFQHGARQGGLVDRLAHHKAGNLFAQGFSAVRGVAGQAKAATGAGVIPRAGTEAVIDEGGVPRTFFGFYPKYRRKQCRVPSAFG